MPSSPAIAYLRTSTSRSTCHPAAILTGHLSEVIQRAGWHRARLVLEVTGHGSIEDYAALQAAIADLRRRGLRVAVDDRGAGYASFRHILPLGPDYIKLDRSLVADVDSDPDRRALTSAAIAFAGDIGATVIAEGVEAEAELRTMRPLDVQAAQGSHTGRPDLASARPAHADVAPPTNPAISSRRRSRREALMLTTQTSRAPRRRPPAARTRLQPRQGQR